MNGSHLNQNGARGSSLSRLNAKMMLLQLFLSVDKVGWPAHGIVTKTVHKTMSMGCGYLKVEGCGIREGVDSVGSSGVGVGVSGLWGS